MNEFSIIEKYFRPLATNFAGSLNLSDDAALLTPPAGHELVITKDAICEGIHFIGTESPDLIASKALRVNLSDLAAMGATPICYFLALMLPKNTSEEWLEKFTSGLKQTQEEFSIALAGGDTTATNGTLSISITAIGSVPTGKALKRSSAKVGDDIYVSGTLGDSAIGLQSYRRKSVSSDFFINRYLTPQPRLELGKNLRSIANSAMDISDGLVQDLEHICTASNVGAVIYSDKVPISSCHPVFITGSGDLLTVDTGSRNKYGMTVETALTGGDDYELLFTASPDKQASIEQLAKSLELPLICIGKITEGKTVKILDGNEEIMKLEKKGFSHF